MTVTAQSPDGHGAGLVGVPLDALRYDGSTDDPHEVAGIMQALMPSGIRVLDVGCGTGSVTLVANASKNNVVAAIEPDPERAAVANARGVDTFCGILDDAYVATHDKFDVVMFSDVLEHLPSPGGMLGTAASALKPDGLVLVSVPNVAHWTVRVKLLFGRFDYEPFGIMDVTHLRWFTERTLRSLFAESGFEVVEMRHSAGAFLHDYGRPPFRLIPRRLRVPLIRRLAKLLPRLFGCQHVVLARKAT